MEKPTYRDVCTDRTGHAELLEIAFDPARVSYQQLLDTFFSVHNPTQLNRQGPDHGTQYRSVIFYHSPEQQQAAETTIARLAESQKFPRPIMTQVVPAQTFWPAEGIPPEVSRKARRRKLPHLINRCWTSAKACLDPPGCKTPFYRRRCSQYAMTIRLKPLSQQTIVITGATSGIGLTTAKEAARRGANVVLAARNEEVLEQVVRDLKRVGAKAIGVPTDVSHRADIERLSQEAINAFGGYDTWVNDAGLALWAPRRGLG